MFLLQNASAVIASRKLFKIFCKKPNENIEIRIPNQSVTNLILQSIA